MWAVVIQIVGYKSAAELRELQAWKQPCMVVFDVPEKFGQDAEVLWSNGNSAILISIVKDSLADFEDSEFWH